MQNVPLSALKTGQQGIVCSVELDGGLVERLQDLGLNPGAAVRCCHIAPAGSPIAFRIAGAMIALREEDACRIMVRRFT